MNLQTPVPLNHPEPTLGRTAKGFTLVELMVVVAILGILAAIAIPTMQLYMRRVKTGEARIQIAKMFDGTVAYFTAEHVERGAVEQIGAGSDLMGGRVHRCPHPEASPDGGEAGITPDIDCTSGPGGRCVPSIGSGEPGHYPFSQWSANLVWGGLGFQMEQPHYFRYNFQASNDDSGYGACQFTSQAFGDLDADGDLSTFERSGAADVNGVNAAGGLYIDRVVE